MGYIRLMIQIIADRYFPPHINMVMSQAIASRLNLPRNPVWITFGSATDMAFIAPIHNQTPLVRLSSRLASRLKLKGQMMLNARYDPHNRRLQLGPYLGILMNRNINSGVDSPQDPPYGVMNRFLEECTQSCKAKGAFLAIFAPENINFETKTIRAWIHENNRWQTTETPMPDVIYNRLTSRRLENQADVQQKLDTLKKRYRVSIFNETFLNKQEVHEMLSKDPVTRNMLPETYPYHIHRLLWMLQRHPVLYLKPTNGSLGHGITRVTRYAGKLICQHSEATGVVTRTSRSLKEGIRQLHRRVSRSKYLIQQGLNLVTLDGRPVDFRALVQKDGRGSWTVTSIVGRIANDQHIVSNLARGGTLRKAADILAEIQTVPNKPTITQLKNTALNIAQTFEHLAEGHFAELGIDLVLDRQGRIWLIEMNSKPSKTDDTIATPTLSTRPSVNRLIEYTFYLTGWSLRKPSRRMKANLPSGTGKNRRKTP